MDIYFCDLCGVRVTDVDLRGGHGIRRVDDVICATCLELGHGKEWLVQHNRPRQPSSTSIQPVVSSKGTDTAALATRPAPARSTPAVAAAKAKESPTLDAGRDRARTVEEDEPEVEPVAPHIIGDFDGIATAATVPDNEAEAAAGQGLDDEPAPRSAPHPRGSDFAAAASGFSALGVRPAPQMRHGAEDLHDDSGSHRELTAEEVAYHDAGAAGGDEDAEAGLETADGSEDRAKAAEGAETADGEPRAGVADDTATAENEAAGLSREDQEAATDENDPPEVQPMKTSEPPRRPAGRPGGPPASSARTPAGRPSTGRIPSAGAPGRPVARTGPASAKSLKPGNSSSKNITAKSGKGAKSSVRTKRKADNKKVFIISAITISIMVIVMIAVTVTRGNRHGAQKVESVNLSKELHDHISNAKKLALSAIDSKNVEQLKSARSAIQDVDQEVATFSQYAKEHGRTEDEVLRMIDDSGIRGVDALKVNIGQEIAKQSVH